MKHYNSPIMRGNSANRPKSTKSRSLGLRPIHRRWRAASPTNRASATKEIRLTRSIAILLRLKHETASSRYRISRRTQRVLKNNHIRSLRRRIDGRDSREIRIRLLRFICLLLIFYFNRSNSSQTKTGSPRRAGRDNPAGSDGREAVRRSGELPDLCYHLYL